MSPVSLFSTLYSVGVHGRSTKRFSMAQRELFTCLQPNAKVFLVVPDYCTWRWGKTCHHSCTKLLKLLDHLTGSLNGAFYALLCNTLTSIPLQGVPIISLNCTCDESHCVVRRSSPLVTFRQNLAFVSWSRSKRPSVLRLQMFVLEAVPSLAVERCGGEGGSDVVRWSNLFISDTLSCLNTRGLVKVQERQQRESSWFIKCAF